MLCSQLNATTNTHGIANAHHTLVLCPPCCGSQYHAQNLTSHPGAASTTPWMLAPTTPTSHPCIDLTVKGWVDKPQSWSEGIVVKGSRQSVGN